MAELCYISLGFARFRLSALRLLWIPLLRPSRLLSTLDHTQLLLGYFWVSPRFRFQALYVITSSWQLCLYWLLSSPEVPDDLVPWPLRSWRSLSASLFHAAPVPAIISDPAYPTILFASLFSPGRVLAQVLARYAYVWRIGSCTLPVTLCTWRYCSLAPLALGEVISYAYV